MTNRKIVQTTAFVLLFSISAAAQTVSGPVTPAQSSTSTTEEPRARQLMDRLETIKNTDRSTLTSHERKDLRKELKGIRKEMKAASGGVYLSVGAILLVILILILIL
jgi:Skp family chaperone for outer membrane proteins